MKPTNSSGFTLIELLVSVAIISLLTSVSMSAIMAAKAKAQLSRAKTDALNLKNAIALLNTDTLVDPLHQSLGNCGYVYDGNEAYVTDPAMGLVRNDPASPYPNWKGPYIPSIPKDPWGQDYIYDGDYECQPSFDGCSGLPAGLTVEVVHSGGPNRSGINVYDADNITAVLCTE